MFPAPRILPKKKKNSTTWWHLQEHLKRNLVDLSLVLLSKQAKPRGTFFIMRWMLQGCIFPLLFSLPSFSYFTPSPTLKLQSEKGAYCPCPPPYTQGWRVTGPCRLGSPCMGRFPGSGWCPWPAPLPLCQSSPSPPPSQLSAPGHLCHSAPSLCLARGHIGMVPAGVCILLWAASWNWVGVGWTPVPEAADHALASPSFLPGVNKSTGFQGAFKCVL